jgi:hypothetical protein
LTELVKQYILNQRQAVDDCWMCDFEYQGIKYDLMFDNEFNLVEIHTLKLVDGSYEWDKVLGDNETDVIYQVFLNTID